MRTRDSELLQIAFLSRHGVRSPTLDEHELLAPYVSDPWPKWDVAAGQLSTHGARLAQGLGAWYRLRYGPALSGDGRPRAAGIYIRADKVQRCIDTARSWLCGFLDEAEPGVDVDHAALDEPPDYDPAFIPVDAGAVAIAGLREMVLGRLGHDIDAAILAHRGPLMLLQSVLGGAIFSPELYGQANEVLEDGTLRGTLFTAQVACDVLTLEHANGWEIHKVGWGRASSEALHDFGRTRTFVDSLLGRAPAYNRAQSSNMAARLLAGMAQRVTGEPSPVEFGPETSVVGYFGHDTGVQSLGGLLGVRWMPRHFVADQTPPCGALAFELHCERGTGEHFVQIRFVAMTPEQMVHASPLSLDYGPSHGRLWLPRATGLATSPEVPWDEFEDTLLAAVDIDCVSEPALREWVAARKGPDRESAARTAP